jgi:hypothetical protein
VLLKTAMAKVPLHKTLGIKRLSLVAGAIAASYRFLNPPFDKKYFDNWVDFIWMLIACSGYFLLLWIAIKVVAWVIAGFSSDREINQGGK